jgi:hypothetical protein
MNFKSFFQVFFPLQKHTSKTRWATLPNKIAHILNQIKGVFNITKGHLEIYVGLHIIRDIFTKTIHIHHQWYIKKIFLSNLAFRIQH